MSPLTSAPAPVDPDPAPAAERSGSADLPVPMGRLGPWFASVWLFFLLSPLHTAWLRRDEPMAVVGGVATVVFVVVYMMVWLRARARSRRGGLEDPRSSFGWTTALSYLLPLVALGALMVATLGEDGLASAVYVAVACVLAFPIRVAAPIVVAITVGVLTLGALEDWGSQVGTAFGVMAASVAIFGVRTVISRNVDLVTAQRANAELAVENERTRFARDLHDILGHSLTVITVKAELAGRLLDVDVERARVEIADLERLSRDALADVRRAVVGYRDITLPGELARARTALSAAQIVAAVPGTTDEVPSELRDLFAWTIREGVTNVIRHSSARRCEVRLAPDRVEIRDDGVGPGGQPAGSGLLGLRERAAVLDATVVTRPLDPGFSLAVVRGASPGTS